MRDYYRRRNPKALNFTVEQEAEYERYERDVARSRIFEMGVAGFLNTADRYSNQIELEEAAQILRDAVALRFHATEGRAAIRKAAEEAEAVKPKRKAKEKTA